jgi:hypothetical protein
MHAQVSGALERRKCPSTGYKPRNNYRDAPASGACSQLTRIARNCGLLTWSYRLWGANVTGHARYLRRCGRTKMLTGTGVV